MKNIAKIMSIMMITTVLLGFAAIFQAKAFVGPAVFIDPTDSIFSTSTVGVGSTFTINVVATNMTDVAGTSFILHWDPLLINCTNIVEVLFHARVYPADWSNINQLALDWETTPGEAVYGFAFQNMQKARDHGYAPMNISTTTNPPSGIATVCTLTFEILKVPTMAEGFLACAFDFVEIKFADSVPNGIVDTTIPVGEWQDGTYRINWAPPTALPYYSVSPATYTAHNVGEIFNINILVNNLVPGWEAVGFQFMLSWNSTILQLLDITNGTWLPPFGAYPNQGFLFMTDPYADHATVGAVVMPDVNGTWHAPFPNTKPGGIETPGVLAVFTFNATLQGLFPITESSSLNITGTSFANWLGQSINQGTNINGYYSIIPKVLGRSIDVYVCNYPDGYNGAGPNQPSDMFWPQKEVCLCANVTYNEWPEQQKDVAFQIIDPHGTIWGVIYARTNQYGTASTCFRLPWPCDNPEYYIGKWTVVGTVDVACTIVNDTLEFKYDYLVRIWKVTADKTDWNHNETVCITVEYGSQAQMPRPEILAVTAKDEVGVPFFYIGKNVTIGGAKFCEWANFTDEICIYVPKWARAGVAEIDVAFLNNYPFFGGTVESGYYLDWLPYGWSPSTMIPEWIGFAPINVNIKANWA
jgi:hypothetical protein